MAPPHPAHGRLWVLARGKEPRRALDAEGERPRPRPGLDGGDYALAAAHGEECHRPRTGLPYYESLRRHRSIVVMPHK